MNEIKACFVTHGVNPLRSLAGMGQSIWLDNLGRNLLASGELGCLIERDGVTGITSNPAIFEKAISGSDDYDDDIAVYAKQGCNPALILRDLMIKDIQSAADLLYPTYAATNGRDGFVSLEVSPLHAHDSEATLAEARELWTLLARKNVMIKIPATRAGLVPIRTLIAEGINVNVTLIFGLSRYQEVCEAWLAGLEDRLKGNEKLEEVTSVASFFLSRIDAKLDPLLKDVSATNNHADSSSGKVAVALAKLAYQHFLHIRQSQRFQELARHGARPQRLLWASTGTKDPSYLDTWYVEALIGADTITTLPMETLVAYREHGCPAERLTEGLEEARATIDGLPDLGINLEAVAASLEDEGIEKFRKPYQALLSSLRMSCQKFRWE